MSREGKLPEHYETTSHVDPQELLVYLPPVLRRPYVATKLRRLSPRYLRMKQGFHHGDAWAAEREPRVLLGDLMSRRTYLH